MENNRLWESSLEGDQRKSSPASIMNCVCEACWGRREGHKGVSGGADTVNHNNAS